MVLLLFDQIVEIEDGRLGEFDGLQVVLGRVGRDWGVGHAIDVLAVLVQPALVILDVRGEGVLSQLCGIEDVLHSVHNVDEPRFRCPLHQLLVSYLPVGLADQFVTQRSPGIQLWLLVWVTLEEYSE